MKVSHLPRLDLGPGNVYVGSAKELLDIVDNKKLTAWMKADEACKLIGESESNFYRRMDRGRIPYRKFNGIKLIPILELLERHLGSMWAKPRAFAGTLEKNLIKAEVPAEEVAEILGRYRELIDVELNAIGLLGGKG